jgi:hypothetical protein
MLPLLDVKEGEGALSSSSALTGSIELAPVRRAREILRKRPLDWGPWLPVEEVRLLLGEDDFDEEEMSWALD